jgi:hypothetical protein
MTMRYLCLTVLVSLSTIAMATSPAPAKKATDLIGPAKAKFLNACKNDKKQNPQYCQCLADNIYTESVLAIKDNKTFVSEMEQIAKKCSESKSSPKKK